ncbi:MAG: glycosyltransferase [Bacteroidetes bacterium]|nr:glycosyltransferase [Bacteroidota bacterium]
MKICHLTSAHPVNDIRIFQKECISLKNAGYDVYLIVNGEQNRIQEGVNIIGTKKIKSRFFRILLSPLFIFFKALKLNAKIYHFHDPELIFVGFILKLFAKKVIFDIHENVALSIKDKTWIPKIIRKLVEIVYRLFERFFILFFDLLILAENSYKKYYSKKKSHVILNYPLVFEKIKIEKNKDFSNPIRFVYSGLISEMRGVFQILDIFLLLLKKDYDIYLDIIGQVESEKLECAINNFISKNEIENRVTLHGYIPVKQVYKILENDHIGFSLLKPIDNYKTSLPTKIFEYMLNGLPVITSNFELYDYYIKEKDTGICVDYFNVNESALQIETLIKDQKLMNIKSKNGKFAVLNEFNWASQENKLIKIYNDILNN